VLDRILYSPFLAQLVVTRRCNLDCGYCNEFDKVSSPVALRRQIAARVRTHLEKESRP
jgi:MoaA/NifB/PqqE/SkfB family radical SAM enzyme